MPTSPPPQVDRVIVHQFDPARPSPGGIDTCLRGICRYLPEGVDVAVVGVDTGAEREGREVGVWEEYKLEGNRRFWFLPVVALDPADQSRRIPHSLRLMAGVLKNLRKIPRAGIVQVHRMDSAVALRMILRRPEAYFIHTQENGLTGTTSDSFWRFGAGLHRWLELSVVKKAKSVVVFNEPYSAVIKQYNDKAVFSPTWFDPKLIRSYPEHRDAYTVLWVGRLEVPKDPMLAVEAFARLVQDQPGRPWRLNIVGPGTLTDALQERISQLPADVSRRIHLMGRVSPEDVAVAMASAGVFLMTSHAGYEGFPRVLVESMASGLPAVVTEGSDTGNLVKTGVTGYVCSRDPGELADRIKDAAVLDRTEVRDSVASLDAPHLVERILTLDHASISKAGQA